MSRWMLVGAMLAGCDINHPVANLVTGAQQVCLDSSRVPLPGSDKFMRRWSFGATIVAVHTSPDTSDSPCAKLGGHVVDFETSLGESFSVGWHTQVEGVDVTPSPELSLGSSLIVRFGEMTLDADTVSHAMVLRAADGNLALAMEDGLGMTVDDLPGASPIAVSMGDAQNGRGWADCGRAMNVALFVQADRSTHVRAGRLKEVTLRDQEVTVVNVGALAGLDSDCEARMPWFVVDGHDHHRRPLGSRF